MENLDSMGDFTPHYQTWIPAGCIPFIWSVWFVWLNSTNQMNKTNQTNQINQC